MQDLQQQINAFSPPENWNYSYLNPIFPKKKERKESDENNHVYSMPLIVLQ